MKTSNMQKTVRITDDFDLEKIANCGQCFRAKRFADGTYRFITGTEVLYIQKTGDGHFSISCTQEIWKRVWTPYFDLPRSYTALRESLQNAHTVVAEAVQCGCGLRVLRQDPWEMLVTFIISQRKNIPAIAKAVETLAQRCGTRMVPACPEAERLSDGAALYAFPTPQQLALLSEEELRDCQLGYRAPYVMDAAQKVASGALDLTALSACTDENLFERLMCVRGVGKKVANCICLFGYGRLSRVPVDVWIARAIQEDFAGEDPFACYGDIAGIIQQYIFYYEKNRPVENNPAENSRAAIPSH